MAVKNKRTTILAAGDHDQITLAFLKFLNHPDIRPFFHRIVGARDSEAMNVGLQAVCGIKTLVDREAENQGSGGQSKQCRSLLQSIAMCLMHYMDDSVSQEAIRRQIISSLSYGTAQRLMKKAGNKRKHFEKKDCG